MGFCKNTCGFTSDRSYRSWYAGKNDLSLVVILIVDIYGLFWLNGHDLVSPNLPSLLLVMMPVLLVGNQIGYLLFDRIDAGLMRKFTLVLLSSLATIALVSALS